MKLLKISTLIFAISLIAFAGTVAGKRPQPARSFVATYLVTRTTAEHTQVEEIQTRFVSADGSWKETRYSLLTGITAARFSDGRGIYEQKGTAVKQVSTDPNAAEIDRAFRSASFHRNHPEFARTETVAGLSAYVHHSSHPEGDWADVYYVPEMGATPIKTVIHSAAGEEIVSEAICVQFRELRDGELNLSAQ